MRLDQPVRSSGLTGNAIRTWGYLFLILGIAGKSILQNRLLGLNTLDAAQLLEVLNAAPGNMMIATCALVLEAIHTCAAPLYTFLLVEGFRHTSNPYRYLARVLGTAAISEIPYNLAMSGRWMDWGSRNPVFGMALCLVMLILFTRYEKKGWQGFLLKAGIAILTMVWTKMLGIGDGLSLVVLTLTFWTVRNKPNFRTMAGMCGAGLCVAFSMFYLAAPMAVLTLHGYNGEPGSQNRLVNYLAYPAALLCVGLGAMFI